MAQFQKMTGIGSGAGVPEAQRPADPTIKGASTTQASAGGKAAESKPTSTEGADALKARGQAGQTLDKMPGAVVLPVATPAGDDGNTQATPDGYPRNAGSRAPIQGSAPGPRAENLKKVQTRK